MFQQQLLSDYAGSMSSMPVKTLKPYLEPILKGLVTVNLTCVRMT